MKTINDITDSKLRTASAQIEDYSQKIKQLPIQSNSGNEKMSSLEGTISQIGDLKGKISSIEKTIKTLHEKLIQDQSKIDTKLRETFVK